MTVIRHDRHRHGFSASLDERDVALLDHPTSQPVLARIAANVDPDYPRRKAHIEMVALVVLRAKRNPTNAYARATL